MSDANPPAGALNAIVIDEHVSFSLVELCRVCGASSAQVIALVGEGVLDPAGSDPEGWRFPGPALSTTLAALRLARDFEIGMAGVALVLELLAEIDAQQAERRRGAVH
jgi:chaperone modulatory protein CbpM